MKEMKLPFYAKFVLVLFGIVLVLFLLKMGAVIFIPLFFALLICVLLYPLAERLEEKNLSRSIATLICILVFLTCTGIFIYSLIMQIIHFSQDFPAFQKRIQLLLYNLQAKIAVKYGINTSQQMDYLNSVAAGMLQGVANSIRGIFASVLEFVIWTIFVFIYSYFMLFHRTLLYRFITGLFKPDVRSKVIDVISDTRSIIHYYVQGLLVELGVIMVVNCSVLSIMGVPYAILLGMITAVLNLIPYLGIYIGMLICVIVTIANGTGGQAVGIIIALIIIHFIDANILMPRIVGSRVKMNALITIIAVIIGSQVWGIAGMFLFIPLVAIIKVIFSRVDGLQPWALLMGTEDKALPEKRKDDSDGFAKPAQE